MKAIDIAGRKRGSLTVIRDMPYVRKTSKKGNSYTERMLFCRCDCGNSTTYKSAHFRYQAHPACQICVKKRMSKKFVTNINGFKVRQS